MLLNNRAGAEINIGEISFENTKAGQGMGLKKNVNWTNSFYVPASSYKARLDNLIGQTISVRR